MTVTYLIRGVVSILLTTALAGAEVQRIAVIIGVDRGLDGERPLRYASRDAEAMAETFRKAGTFDADRIYLVVNAPLEKIKANLEAVRGRVAELRKAGNESLVLLYFSGHGGPEGLHVQGKTFSKDDLNEYFGSLESNLKIVILDACQSGDFLRNKGGRILDTPQMVKLDRLESQGTIMISSSSRGEMAQESEDYKGAVFTHHFLNGLRGLADYDGDQNIRLMEAFDYARVSTRKEEIMGETGQQNPSFDFDMTGESDPVMAKLGREQCQLVLKGMPAGPMEIYNGHTLDLESNIWLTGQDSVRFCLPSNKYILAYGDKDASRILEVDLTWRQRATVEPGYFKKKTKSLLYGKGGRSLDLQFNGAEYSLRRFDPFGGPLLHQIGYVYRNYQTKQTLGVMMASAQLDGGETGLRNTLRIYGVGYAIEMPLVRTLRGQLLAGAGVSWEPVFQRIQDNRFGNSPVIVNGAPVNTDRRVQSNLYRGTIPLECEMYFPYRLWLSASAAPALYIYPSGASGALHAEYGIEPGLALGHQF